jgi:photosystem II stability/assembly factor-like uncharacterized protein
MRKIIFLLLITIFFAACNKQPFSFPWKKINVASQEGLYSINILNDTVYVFGGATYDKGIAIKAALSNPQPFIDSVAPKVIYNSFYSEETQWLACGYDGKIYNAENATATWNIIQTASWRALQKIDSKCGWSVAVGGLGNKGVIQQNYIPNWQWFETLYDKELKGVAIVDSQKAFIVGNGIVLQTDNRGDNWKPLDLRGDMFTDIKFVNENVGYILGYSGLMFKTTNGGNSWQEIKIQKGRIFNRGFLNALYFADENLGFICGNDGTILKTTDGGNSWQQAEYPHNTNFFNIVYLKNLNKGFACGNKGTLIEFGL